MGCIVWPCTIFHGLHLHFALAPPTSGMEFPDSCCYYYKRKWPVGWKRYPSPPLGHLINETYWADWQAPNLPSQGYKAPDPQEPQSGPQYFNQFGRKMGIIFKWLHYLTYLSPWSVFVLPPFIPHKCNSCHKMNAVIHWDRAQQFKNLLPQVLKFKDHPHYQIMHPENFAIVHWLQRYGNVT